MIMNIYRNINRTKIQFDFIVNENEKEYGYEAEIKRLGGTVYRIPRFTIANWLVYEKAWKCLLNDHPEWRIIHGHHTAPAFIYLKVANSFNRVTIAHSHTSGGDKSVKSRLKVLFRFPLRYLADYLFACSNSSAEWMFGKRNKSTYIINNAIELKKFAYNEVMRNKKRSEFKFENNLVVGHVGNFHPSKNHDFLIQIFYELHKQNCNAILLLIGEGNLRQSIETKIMELELSDSVILTGSRSDVSELFQVMDVFVFPSKYEGLPVTVIEAQAAGLLCFLSDTITDEVAVTELVQFISLQESEKYWADLILKHGVSQNRLNTCDEIKSKGYDIEKNTKWVEEFYLEKARR